jgi:hypothetical protein
MLALVRKHTKFGTRFFFLSAVSMLAACATQKEPPALVSDPSGKPESALPWNKQEKWELAGGLPSQLTEGR